MADKVGEEFDGIISSVVKFGLFVELPNTIEGLIHITALKQDYFHYLENHLALVGERTGQTFKIGQKVRIKVIKADPETREIDFELIEAEEVVRIQQPKKQNKENKQRRQTSDRQKKKIYGENLLVKRKKRKFKKKPFYKGIKKK